MNSENYHLAFESKIKIIINADDLGICKERDEGIFELYINGLISSTSILMNVINSINSIRKAKELNVNLGIHLNLTEGEPLYKKDIETNSLVSFNAEQNKYVMHGKFGLRERISNHSIKEIDVKNEIIEQIQQFFFYYKSYPSHIDGHQHIHVIPFIAKILSDIMVNIIGIYRIRLPLENEELLEKYVSDQKRLAFYKQVTHYLIRFFRLMKIVLIQGKYLIPNIYPIPIIS